MINKLSKFGLLFFLLGIFFGNDSNAQTPVCNLQFDIFELNSEKAKVIDKAEVVLTDLATNKTSKSLVFTEKPTFNNLTSGKYKVEIIKNGYQRRIKEFELDCKSSVEILTISKVLYLQKGNVKEVTKFRGTKYIGEAKVDDAQYKSKSEDAPVNSNATNLAIPTYPAAARAVRASGAVNVQVKIDEDGEVVIANAVSGHPLLRQAAEKAAKESRFLPTTLAGQIVTVTGIIVYNFVP